MKKKLLIFLLCTPFIYNSYSQSITSQSFKVNGNGTTFYPVVFTETNWSDGATEFELSRSNVHLDASWWGSMIAKFRFHTYQWGNGANFIDADIRNGSYNCTNKTFIADWMDVTGGNGSVSIVVWLRGQSTYYFRSTNSVMSLPTVYINGYQVINGSILNPITTINPNLNQNGITHSGNGFFMGNGFFGGNVGVGTNSPSAPLEINSSTNDRGLVVGANGKNTKIYLHVSSSDYGYLCLGGNTQLRGNGQASYFEGKVDVANTIHAKEVKVDLTGWSDFVFAPAYKLKPLTYVEQYIKTNGHLPEIPSANEVAQNGVSLGDMQAKLLQKVEELTLYSIEQDKKLQEQNEKLQLQLQENAELKKEMKELKELVMRKLK